MTSWAYVDVFIFACAATNNETDVGDARDRMYNMRDMISHLVSVNKTKFSPAWIGRPAEGGRPLPDSNTDPPFFVMVFPVKFQYEED